MFCTPGTMWLGCLLQLGLLVLASSAGNPQTVRRQTATTKYCPGGTQICFSQYQEPTTNITYRIAIPDVPSAPFDILIQIVAPIDKAGWAGIAWGGKMTNNPLTVGWPNGDTAVVSSRWTTGHTLPTAYSGATYALLPSTTTNTTHWHLDVLCTGCSQWANGGALDPNGANELAWAKGTRAVASPSSNTSAFGAHDAKGVFAHDLSVGKIPQGVFSAVVAGLGAASSTAVSTGSVPVSTSTSSPVVTTLVTVLPKPSTSSVTSVVVGTVPATVTVTVTVPASSPTTTQGSGGWGIGPPWRGPPWRGPPWRRPPSE